MSQYTISLKFDGRNSAVLLGIYAKSGLIDNLIDVVCHQLESNGKPTTFEQIKVHLIEDDIQPQSAKISLACEGAEADIFESAIEQILDNLNDLIRREIWALESRGEGKFDFKLLESEFYLIPDAVATR